MLSKYTKPEERPTSTGTELSLTTPTANTLVDDLLTKDCYLNTTHLL